MKNIDLTIDNLNNVKTDAETIEKDMQQLLQAFPYLPRAVIMGMTGSGKSSLAACLSKSNVFIKKIKKDIKLEGPGIKDGKTSATNKPTIKYIESNPTIIYCDCPGFQDTRGHYQEIINSLIIDNYFRLSDNNFFNIILVISEKEIDERRGQSIADLFDIITKMFPNFDQIKQMIALVITKGNINNTVDDYIDILSEDATGNLLRWCNHFKENKNSIFLFPMAEEKKLGCMYTFDDQKRLENFLMSKKFICPIHKIALSEETWLSLYNLQSTIMKNIYNNIQNIFISFSADYCKEKTSSGLQKSQNIINMIEYGNINRILELENIFQNHLANFHNYTEYFNNLKKDEILLDYANYLLDNNQNESYLRKYLIESCKNAKTTLNELVKNALYREEEEKKIIEHQQESKAMIQMYSERENSFKKIQTQLNSIALELADIKTLVIDNGSGMIKAGFSGDDAPISVFPSIVGIPTYNQNSWSKVSFVGDEACAQASILNLNYPIEYGIVTNWENMEKIWHHTFYNELRVDPSEHLVLLTEPPMNPKANREKMIQLMFETFNTPSFYCSIDGQLSLYSTGRTSGIVLDSGYSTTNIIPIYEGYSLPHAIQHLNFGGKNISSFLEKILTKRGFKFVTDAEKQIVVDIMEKLTYVSIDFDEERKIAFKTTECDCDYILPDNNVISIASERFICTELFFKPYMDGFEYDGIDKTLIYSIEKCDKECHNLFFDNIALSGGASMFEGFPDRIEKEISLLRKTKDAHVIAHPERKIASWIGGSILASLSSFPHMVITHDEYNEEGPIIIHRRCF